MATKPKNDNDNIVVDSGPSTGNCLLPLDGTTKNNDDKVTTTLVTTEPPILMLTGLDVAAITLMPYIADLLGPEAVLPRSVEGEGPYHSSSSSSSSSSSTGNDDEQVTAMVTTGPQMMLTGLYIAALCTLETNEDGGSTTENCTTSLSMISINLFDFLTALLLLRPLYYFNPAIGVMTTKKNNNNSNDNNTYAQTKTTNCHNRDEYGGALLFDDEYAAEMESLAGKLRLSAGQLGSSNTERSPVRRRPVVKGTGTAAGTGPSPPFLEGTTDQDNNTNDEEQITPARDSTTKKNNNNSNANSAHAKTKTTNFHNRDEYGGALLFDDEYAAEMESLAGQLGLRNKERLPVTNVLDLPSSLLLDCFLYLDLISSMIVSTLNKQCRAVVRGPGMEALFRPLLHISTSGARKHNHRRLLQQLYSNREKLQIYTEATIIDVNQFDNFDDWRDVPFFRLRGLESLTISSTSPPPPLRPRTIAQGFSRSLLHSLQCIMPNIQRIDFSGANFSSVHRCPLRIWPRLTEITWNGIGISDDVRISGYKMKLLINLREMYMDDSYFGWDLRSLPRSSDQFIFQKCCQNLERMSIRNARHYKWGSNTLSSVTQQELIKFVRNAPSLKWFRSDLTLDNITMLQNEYPGIELLS